MDVIFASVVVLFYDGPMACILYRMTAAVQAAKQQQGAVACTALCQLPGWPPPASRGSSCSRSCGVVVITSALHAEGPQFDPGRDQATFLPQLVKLDTFSLQGMIEVSAD